MPRTKTRVNLEMQRNHHRVHFTQLTTLYRLVVLRRFYKDLECIANCITHLSIL